MRYSSVWCTVVVPVRARRRFGFFVCSKCRLPARGRNTLPVAVILKRLATDFFVLMPLGRRINRFLKKSAQYTDVGGQKQGVICKFENRNPKFELQKFAVLDARFGPVERFSLSTLCHAGWQTVLPALGRVPWAGRKIV